MRSLLVGSGAWAVCLAVLFVATTPCDPCLVPARRLGAVERAYLSAYRRLSRMPARADRYDALIAAAARRRRLDPRLLKAVIAAESGFDPMARSPRGAVGLMQVMPATARELGVKGSLNDPIVNIRAGAAYLALLHQAAYRRFGLVGRDYARAPYWLEKRVAAAYNAGPKALSGRGWCRQTRLYADKVMFFYSSRLAVVTPPPLIRQAPAALVTASAR